MEIEVKGHSGCSIDIIQDASGLCILKSTHDKTYLNRLINQAKKQQRASEIEYQHIRVPKIFNIVHDENHVSVRMEYIYSKNFIEYFETAGFEQISYFIKALKIFLEWEIKESPIKQIPKEIFINKFLDVENKIANNHLLKSDYEVKAIIEESHNLFLEMEDMSIPIGHCHGDLTFSNILFNGNNYFLIDFLDSFIESPIIDMVKLRQDSYYRWSSLMYKGNFDKCRLQIITNKIDCLLVDYFSQYSWYSQYYLYFQLMNLLRVLQYAKEENVISFLKRHIKSLLK